MTERFIYDDLDIIDNSTNNKYSPCLERDLKQIIVIMNCLHKENQRLKNRLENRLENEQYKEKIERVFRIAYNETKLTETTKKTLQKIAEVLDIGL